MRYKKLLCLFLLAYIPLNAQVNVDSIFSKAVELGKAGQYTSALTEAHNAFQSDTSRRDILVYMANLYSWNNKNDSALVYIHKAAHLNYHETEFYETWSNILLRTHRFEELLACCNEAEKYNYLPADILKKRLIAYSELNDYDKGILLAADPSNQNLIKTEPINSLYTNMLLKRNKNAITAYYTADLVENVASPQHLASLGYLHTFKNDVLGLRSNYTNRYGLHDFQLEADYYRLLNDRQYLYLNYGYGFNATLFPAHRIGLEYYFPLKAKTDASLGGRYFRYSSNEVYIVTGHIGTYFGKSLAAIRPYYVYGVANKVHSASVTASYRLFGKNELYYWGLELGFGNSPDDTYAITQNGFNQLNAYKIKIEKNFMLNRVSDLHVAAGFTREEFQASDFRNKVTIEVGYKIRFK